MCAIDGGESYVFYSKALRKAKKAHRCHECGRDIRRGEHFEEARGVYDGSWYRHKTCAHCIAARSWLNVECHGFLHEGVLEELVDHYDYGSEYRSVWLARAIIGMRKGWKRKDGSLLDVPPLYERPSKESA